MIDESTPARRPWHRFLADRRLKSTAARRAILEAFFGTRGHVSLADIQEVARKEAPHVGLATVYRTMKLLEDAGLAKRHEFQGEASRYEPTGGEHHDHCICQVCGDIAEFESPEIERLQNEVARSFGFELKTYRLELYGLCRSCRIAARPV
jgi:Fur family ferric uptake transcriptional regulator